MIISRTVTTSQRKIESTTPKLAPYCEPATPQEEPSVSCCSSIKILVPHIINTVFAKSSQPREVIVNPARIKASLEAFERNRKLQKMGLG